MFDQIELPHLIAMVLYSMLEFWLGKTTIVKPNSVLEVVLNSLIYLFKKILGAKNESSK